jgi:D-alanyl-lipoteichoic acid acyltransferase DltB (MBOAT superfamily)
MLFNSLEFILIFLPIVTLVFLTLERLNYLSWALAWLSLASLGFYAYGQWQYSLLLIGSLGINYWLGRLLLNNPNRYLLILGISGNLLVLAYFKYTHFFLANLSYVTAWQLPNLEIVLPLGISFFTFQKIAFLVDVYKSKIQPRSFIKYVLFISFFPQLIAGPIVHYQEVVPQMGKQRHFATLSADLKIGLTIFLIGLFKKYALADSLALTATQVFTQADQLAPLDTLDAWRGVLAYGFQIYFDFSGYSDMAIGLGKMFGFNLPLNFFSPYKANNIAEFWRRWHMTLSRFLRDYLYIPLGGNQRGRLRTGLNLIIVMFLGGLWHGAGWNFVIWGLLHGCYLAIHQLFIHIRGKLAIPPKKSLALLSHLGSWVITFMAINIAWIFFRAKTLSGAIHLLTTVTTFSQWTWHLNITTDFYLVLALVITLFLPNTWQLMRHHIPHIIPPVKTAPVSWLNWHWQFNDRWAAIAGLLMAVIIIKMIQGQPTEFIYFQF